MAETDEIPTLTQLLIELSKSWNSYWLTKTTSADNPVHNLVLTKIPSVLKSWAGSNSKLKFEGSDGRGNLVRTPWVATFNLDITSSATRGFYPVYLFRDNMKEMVLEVGFGAPQFEEVYGRGAKFFDELQKAVIGMQNSSTHLLEVLDKPVRERISLKPTVLDESDDFKLKAYEKCSIYSLHYALDNLPSEDQLKYDYLQILKLYDLMANSVVLPSEEEYVLEQTKSPRVIDLTEIIDFLPVAKNKRESNLANGQTSNRRYSKASQKIGKLGEEFIYNYERKILLEGNRPDLVEQVIWHTNFPENRTPGWDITSYDLKGNKKLIEVKSSTGTKISSVVLTSQEWKRAQEPANADIYYIYLVSNVLSKPKIQILKNPKEWVTSGILNIQPDAYLLDLTKDNI